jgi:hypothetical protein
LRFPRGAFGVPVAERGTKRREEIVGKIRAATGRVRLGAPAALTRELTAAQSFALLASMIVSFLAGSSAPTPLYAFYQAKWGFSPITITVIFGVYALAVLGSLLTAGSLSDYVGRRPVLFVAVGLQAAAMVIFATATGVTHLLVARVVQGLSAGAALGALGAGMLDLDRAKGTVANSVAPMVGSATGGVVSGFMVQFLPAPMHLVYLVMLGVFAVQAIGVVRMPETCARRPGALASLRPRFHLPDELRAPVLLATPLLVAAWALVGFYGSLAPTLVRRLVDGNSAMLGGLSLFALAASGAVTVLVLQSNTARTMMIAGASGLLAGNAITLLAVGYGSSLGFFAGTVVAGAGFGAGFQGALRSVIPLAPPHARAGVLSVLYVISYLAMGLPAVLAGVRVVHGGGVSNAAREYGAMVMLLATAALVGVVTRRQAARG